MCILRLQFEHFARSSIEVVDGISINWQTHIYPSSTSNSVKFNTTPRPSSTTSSHLQSAAFGYCAGKSGDVISPPSLADPVLDKSILKGVPVHGSPSSGTLNINVFIKSNASKSSLKYHGQHFLPDSILWLPLVTLASNVPVFVVLVDLKWMNICVPVEDNEKSAFPV